MFLSVVFHGRILFCLLVLNGVSGFLLTPSRSPPTLTSGLPSLAEPPVRIASFNIQVFGHTKYSKDEVRQALVKILSQYDIIQVLEIRDSRGTVFEHLCNDLNTYMKTLLGNVDTVSYTQIQWRRTTFRILISLVEALFLTIAKEKYQLPHYFRLGQDATYARLESARLGRTTSKEQYGFLYRTKHLSVVDSYQMSDLRDEFEREPFGVRFRSPTTVLKEFGMVALHIQPSNALAEMNLIPKIRETFKNHWHLDDILISGDFNADCQYLSQEQWTNVTTRDDPNYQWLIDETTDTTVSPSRCSYDKLWVLVGTTSPSTHKLWSKIKGLKISDHYPIELQLEGNPHMQIQQQLATKTSFTVKDNVDVADINNIRQMYRQPSCAPKEFMIKLQREDTHMDFVTATVTAISFDEVMPRLMTFSANCTGVLSQNLLAMVDSYMKANYLSNNIPQIYGLVKSQAHSFEVTVKCWLVSPNICEVSVAYSISGV